MKILNRSPFLIASGTEDLKEISNHLLQRANKIFKLRDGLRMGFSKTNEKFYSYLFFADFDHYSIYAFLNRSWSSQSLSKPVVLISRKICYK